MTTPAGDTPADHQECHCDGELMPRWRGPEVMDDDSKAMGFICHQCGREYLPNAVRDRKLISPRVPGA